jgi:hypothetical protein
MTAYVSKGFGTDFGAAVIIFKVEGFSFGKETRGAAVVILNEVIMPDLLRVVSNWNAKFGLISQIYVDIFFSAFRLKV